MGAQQNRLNCNRKCSQAEATNRSASRSTRGYLTQSPTPHPQVFITHLHSKNTAVLTAVLSFPIGSAGGLDGLRNQHLKDLLLETGGYLTGMLQG